MTPQDGDGFHHRGIPSELPERRQRIAIRAHDAQARVLAGPT
jgi:hypothetical protein